MLDRVRESYAFRPRAACSPHVTTQMEAMRRGAPVDLVFQSIAGTEAANASFGVNIAMLGEAREPGIELKRGTLGDNVMYFETGQGSALSANAHHGIDQQTCEARAYGRGAAFSATASEYGGRLYRPGISVRRQADSARGSRGSLLRQASGPSDGLRHLLHQSCRSRSGRYGRAADHAGRGRASTTSWVCRAPTMSC